MVEDAPWWIAKRHGCNRDKTEEVIENMVYSDEPEEENCDISRYGTTISGEMIEETTSHDQKFGWKVEETPVQKEGQEMLEAGSLVRGNKLLQS